MTHTDGKRALGVLVVVATIGGPSPAALAGGGTLVSRLQRATARWRASCSRPVDGGLCARPRSAQPGARCAPTLSTALLLVPSRRSAAGRRAVKRLEGLLAQVGARPASSALRVAAAAGAFALAEARHEAFLALRFPTGLDFSSRDPARAKRSLKRFAGYLKGRAKLLHAARARYQRAAKLDPPGQATAANHRVGQLLHHFARELATPQLPSPAVPPAVRGAKARAAFVAAFNAAFCDKLRGHAAPLAAKARQAFDICLKARQAPGAARNPWLRRCAASRAAAAKLAGQLRRPSRAGAGGPPRRSR